MLISEQAAGGAGAVFPAIADSTLEQPVPPIVPLAPEPHMALPTVTPGAVTVPPPPVAVVPVAQVVAARLARVTLVPDNMQSRPRQALLDLPPWAPWSNASRVLRLSATLQHIKDSNAAIEYVGGGGGEGVLNLYLDVAPGTSLLQGKRIGARAIRIFEHYANNTQAGQYSLTVTLTDASARRQKNSGDSMDSPIILVGTKLRYGPRTFWTRGSQHVQ